MVKKRQKGLTKYYHPSNHFYNQIITGINMKQKIFALMFIIAVASLFVGMKGIQQERRPNANWGGPPPQAPIDTAAMRARQDSIQAFLDKLNSAIDGKQDSPATAVFQNIQLFKKASAGRVLGQMRSWTRALGVNCTYCHVPPQWEKDDMAPKVTARSMDKFEDDVNDLLKNIKSITDDPHVGCFTCHRGQPKPEGSGPRRGGPGGPGRGGR